MSFDVVLKIAACLMFGVVLVMLLIYTQEILEAVGVVESEDEDDSAPTLVFLNDFTFPGEDLAEPEGETQSSDLSFAIEDELVALTELSDELILTPGPSTLVFGADPNTLESLMSYDADKNRWTLSDRFLADVADALVSILEERGFAQISVAESYSRQLPHQQIPVWCDNRSPHDIYCHPFGCNRSFPHYHSGPRGNWIAKPPAWPVFRAEPEEEGVSVGRGRGGWRKREDE